MCTDAAGDADLAALRARARRRTATTRGWSRSARSASTTSSPASTATARQRFFAAQLELAREFELPVLLHVRRSVDSVLKHLRSCPVRGGIAHAFNGSEQQAGAFVDLGFKLGFGGAVTFERALRIRRVAAGRAARRHRDGDRRARHPAAVALPHAPRRGPPARRCATSRPSCRASPPCWPSCAASTSAALAAATTANAVAALPRLAAAPGSRRMSATRRRPSCPRSPSPNRRHPLPAPRHAWVQGSMRLDEPLDDRARIRAADDGLDAVRDEADAAPRRTPCSSAWAPRRSPGSAAAAAA